MDTKIKTNPEVEKQIRDLENGRIDGAENGLDNYRRDDNDLADFENEECTGGFDDGKPSPCK